MNSIQIQTFLECPNIAWPLPVEEIDAVITQGTMGDDLEGYIQLEINEMVILGEQHTDNILMIWGLITNNLPSFFAGQTLSVCLPDQPVTLSFEPRGRQVTLARVGDGPEVRQQVDRVVFNRAILLAARTFFERLPSFAPGLEPMSQHYLKILSRASDQ